jgi:CRP/FNR family transcriptional regulator
MTLAMGSDDSYDERTGAVVRFPREKFSALTQCDACLQRPHCFGFAAEANAVASRKRLSKGGTLFRPGDPFTAIYAIRTGSFKTVMTTEDGREQVSACYIRGETLGFDGLDPGRHASEAIALEDSEVCILPFPHLAKLARDSERTQRALYRMLAREIGREREMMLMLGTMRAEQRVAAFLIDLARRFRDRGYSSTEFVLRMTRDEIGSHLGLQLETVSRVLSRMQREGLIQVQGRVVKLLDPGALRKLIASDAG